MVTKKWKNGKMEIVPASALICTRGLALDWWTRSPTVAELHYALRIRGVGGTLFIYILYFLAGSPGTSGFPRWKEAQAQEGLP